METYMAALWLINIFNSPDLVQSLHVCENKSVKKPQMYSCKILLRTFSKAILKYSSVVVYFISPCWAQIIMYNSKSVVLLNCYH